MTGPQRGDVEFILMYERMRSLNHEAEVLFSALSGRGMHAEANSMAAAAGQVSRARVKLHPTYIEAKNRVANG